MEPQVIIELREYERLREIENNFQKLCVKKSEEMARNLLAYNRTIVSNLKFDKNTLEILEKEHDLSGKDAELYYEEVQKCLKEIEKRLKGINLI